MRVYLFASFHDLLYSDDMSHRNAQIAGIIRSIVASHALRIPPSVACVVSVVDVRLSEDIQYADIAVAAVSGVEKAIAHLTKAQSSIRREIASRLRLHRVPILRFHHDIDGSRAHRIDLLLDQIAQSSPPVRSSRRRRTV